MVLKASFVTIENDKKNIKIIKVRESEIHCIYTKIP